jgi:hypothetical protein
MPDSDTRFQFQVIQELAQSVRAMGETQTRMLERLARIEEHRVHEAVHALTARVDNLEGDRDRRDGALGMLGTIKSWAPFLAMLFSAACVLWLYGRSAGLVPAPPAEPTRREAAHQEGALR